MIGLKTFVFSLLILLGSSGSVLAQTDTTPEEDFPDPVPLVDTGGYDLLNFLLLGSDTSNPQNSGRTDAIMVVSINRDTGSVALLSIPRDLYVYIPEIGMNRINTAYASGEMVSEGSGAELLSETIRYNLGLEIDFYARVDFVGFKQIVDAVGGVEVAVDCAIQDWQLAEPDADPAEEANWVMFTLPVGIQRLDGDLALWYARSRRTSSDIDRGQRQQALVRALWRHVRQLGLFEQLIDIWPQLLDLVETDVMLPDVLALVPLAVEMDLSRISSYTLQLNEDVEPWFAPDGASVLLPKREQVLEVMQDFVLPPPEFQLENAQTRVRIVNASGNNGLSRVVADKLAWDGFAVVVDDNPPGISQQLTSIRDLSGQAKGSRLDELRSLLRVHEVTTSPDTNREYDFEVTVGWSFYACTRNVLPPETGL